MSLEKPQIITVSKDDDLLNRTKEIFSNGGMFVTHESSLDQLLKKFKTNTYDVVIITSSACKQNGKSDLIDSLDLLTSKCPGAQILFLAEPEDIDLAISALKAGTFQYTKLPVGDNELRLLIETALEKQSQFGTNLLLQNEKQNDRFEQLAGKSTIMQKVYQQLRQAAATEIPVLLIGETGTGKDLAAQAIHRKSERNQGPYVPVNLGSIPSELVASELFGHEKGAFTGAHIRHKGKFEQANDGTIFLDEIDTINEKVQVSLLRLIEQHKFHRLGGKRAISGNARLITATNSDIDDLVDENEFREDLFYRLDVFRITMPPLRKRYGDIPLLVEKFILRYNQSLEKNILEIAPECIQALEAYNWPGNVRELKNVIQRAVLVCEGPEILPGHLPARFQSNQSSLPSVAFEIGTPLQEVEREMILRALDAANNNRTEAARLLGISRRAIYNKLRKHHIL